MSTSQKLHIETLTVGMFEENCYVVWKDPTCALIIDPGAEYERIADFINQQELKVAAYLLTHGHADHISALPKINKLLPAPALIHKEDAQWAFRQANQIPPYYDAPLPQPPDVQLIHDDQELKWDAMEARVLTTPGHTPGSVCFYFGTENVLFSGDTLFKGSVGRTDLPGGDPRRLSDSLKELAELPDTTDIYCGHGPVTRMDVEKRTNYFMRG